MDMTQAARAGDGKAQEAPALDDEALGYRLDDVYDELRKTGFNGGMAGVAWSNAVYRAAWNARGAFEMANASADRAHAEAYYRQAERLLTANEQTLRAERDALKAALQLMLRGTQEDCGCISMPSNEAVRAAFAALAAAPAAAPAWQPIETAPKDVLVWVSATKRMSGPCIAMHHSRDGWVIETPSEWVSIYTPKHWMPYTPPAGPGEIPAPATGPHGEKGGA